jgi:hypothetical protein
MNVALKRDFEEVDWQKLAELFENVGEKGTFATKLKNISCFDF